MSSSSRLRNLSQIVNCIEQTARVVFNARPLAVYNDPLNQNTDNLYQCDRNQKTSPYLKRFQQQTGQSQSDKNCRLTNMPAVDINEVGQRLAVFTWAILEYVKFVQNNRNQSFCAANYRPPSSPSLDDFQTSTGRSADSKASIDSKLDKKLNDSTEKLKASYFNYRLPEQKLNEQSKATRVPASRIGRILSYGELAAGLGVGAVTQITRKSLGLAPESESVLLSEANANRIVETLCKVRGAALKIGQLLSIQDENLISPQLQRIFERVRYSADFMPESQLKKVMQIELGPRWQEHFARFEMKPFAAASIGQVHQAVLKDGTEVAVKIQYPGVAEGIDSDLKNLVSVLKLWNILPRGMFIETIVAVTRRELAWEVDYKREAEMAKLYRTVIEQRCPNERIYVPKIYDQVSTGKVITSEMIYGIPIDKLLANDIHKEIVNDVAARLLHLCLREIFEFRLMQTDPNWSNFFYNPVTDVISLIDFGATRTYSKSFVDKYIRILKGAADKNREQILQESISIGFLSGYETQVMKNAHIDSVLILGRIFHEDDKFDFGKQDISERIHKIVPVMIEHRLVPPPEEIYSLHRKVSGIFMLLTKLKAKINSKIIFDQVYNNYTFDDTS